MYNSHSSDCSGGIATCILCRPQFPAWIVKGSFQISGRYGHSEIAATKLFISSHFGSFGVWWDHTFPPVQYGLWIQKVLARMQPRSDGTPADRLQLRRLCTVRLYWSWSPHGWSSFAVAFDHGEKQGNKEHAWLAKSFFSGLRIVTISLCTGHFHPSGSEAMINGLVLEWSYHSTHGGFHREWSDVHNILICPSGFAALTSPKKLCSACQDRH